MRRKPSKFSTYKEAILSALDCLEEAEGHAMAGVLNIAFSGTYKELGRLHEVGEIFKAEPGMFADTGDTNIDLILKVVEAISNTRETIKNLNGMN